jgi:hypothetical protein
VHQTIESNGSSKHLQGTLTRGQTTLLNSGNLHHPAGPLGKSHLTCLNIQKIIASLFRVPSHTTQINDGQSPSHLVPGKLRQLGPDIQQTTTTTQKDEWFV